MKRFPTSKKTASYPSRKIAKLIAELADDKKAEDILVLDMRQLINFCDYFVICSGTSDPHLKAIADGVSDGLEKIGINVSFKKGMKGLSWIALDVGDIIVHIFQKEARDFYRLEYLWQNAVTVNWQSAK